MFALTCSHNTNPLATLWWHSYGKQSGWDVSIDDIKETLLFVDHVLLSHKASSSHHLTIIHLSLIIISHHWSSSAIISPKLRITNPLMNKMDIFRLRNSTRELVEERVQLREVHIVMSFCSPNIVISATGPILMILNHMQQPILTHHMDSLYQPYFCHYYGHPFSLADPTILTKGIMTTSHAWLDVSTLSHWSIQQQLKTSRSRTKSFLHDQMLIAFWLKRGPQWTPPVPAGRRARWFADVDFRIGICFLSALGSPDSDFLGDWISLFCARSVVPLVNELDPLPTTNWAESI